MPSGTTAGSVIEAAVTPTPTFTPTTALAPTPTPAPKPLYKRLGFILLVFVVLLAGVIVYVLDRQGRINGRGDKEGKEEMEPVGEREEEKAPEEEPEKEGEEDLGT